MKSKYVEILPFIVFCAIISYTWYQLLSNDYIPTIKHIASLILALANIGAYFWNYKKGLVITGAILVIASLSLVAISFEVVSNSAFFKIGSIKVTFPSLNYLALGLLLFYCIVNLEAVKDTFKRIAKLF